MKNCKTTYLSIFFLLCFTASFSANAVQNLRTNILKSDLSHLKVSSVSTKEEGNNSNTNILLEKNENETEKSLDVQSYLLPFYISFFQFEVLQPLTFFAGPLAEKSNTPIFIEVCSFRI